MSLEDDVFGPLNEPGEVAFGQNVVADSEVAGLFIEEGVRFLFDFLGSFLAFLSFGLSEGMRTIVRLKIID